jgi:hypothetical protein
MIVEIDFIIGEEYRFESIATKRLYKAGGE